MSIAATPIYKLTPLKYDLIPLPRLKSIPIALAILDLFNLETGAVTLGFAVALGLMGKIRPLIVLITLVANFILVFKLANIFIGKYNSNIQPFSKKEYKQFEKMNSRFSTTTSHFKWPLLSLFGSNTFEAILEHPNGKKTRALESKSPFARGGDSEVRLLATRDKHQHLKFWAHVIPRQIKPSVIKGRNFETTLFTLQTDRPITCKTRFLENYETLRKLASGGNLLDYIQQHKTINKSLLAKQVIAVLASFWETNHVHLDIKLENFLIHSGTVFLIDFNFTEPHLEEKQPLRKGTRRAQPFSNTKSSIEIDYLHADFHALGVALLEIYLGKSYSWGAKNDHDEFWKSITTLYHPLLKTKLEEFRSAPVKNVQDQQIKDLIFNLIYHPETITIETLKRISTS